MSNEPSTSLCEHSNNQVCVQDNIPADKLHQVVQTENKETKDILDGHNITHIPNESSSANDNRVTQINEKHDYPINNLIFDFSRSSKIIDEELDKISLSSSSDDNNNLEQPKAKLTAEVYEKEMHKI